MSKYSNVSLRVDAVNRKKMDTVYDVNHELVCLSRARSRQV
jgi:hypothetical protein